MSNRAKIIGYAAILFIFLFIVPFELQLYGNFVLGCVIIAAGIYKLFSLIKAVKVQGISVEDLPMYSKISAAVGLIVGLALIFQSILLGRV